MSSSKYLFVGNNICIDFINTKIIEKRSIKELIVDYNDLMQWFQDAEIIDKKEKIKLIAKWNTDTQISKFFIRSIAFREDLRSMINKLIDTQTVEDQRIVMINKILSKQCEQNQLEMVNDKLELITKALIEEPVHLLTSIARSAAFLLSHSDYSPIKRCENPGCILYHYDTSKNHKRRWCSMNICGNRMKAAAHYKRKKKLAKK